LTIAAIALRAEVVKRCHLAGRSNPEYIATAISSAVGRRSIQIPVESLHESSVRIGAVRSREAVQRRESLCSNRYPAYGTYHQDSTLIFPPVNSAHANPPDRYFCSVCSRAQWDNPGQVNQNCGTTGTAAGPRELCSASKLTSSGNLKPFCRTHDLTGTRLSGSHLPKCKVFHLDRRVGPVAQLRRSVRPASSPCSRN